MLILGFSFKPPLRAPFDKIIRALHDTKLPIISVDIPSGWDVEKGSQPLNTQPDDNGRSEVIDTFDPEALVSLTAPKEGAKEYKGRHWIANRFIPE